jgi:hypothetical protein
MSNIPEFDRKLSAQLQSMIDQLAALRESLYMRGHGCACDETGLCSHHAMVHGHLVAAADSLARAIGEAQREE